MSIQLIRMNFLVTLNWGPSKTNQGGIVPKLQRHLVFGWVSTSFVRSFERCQLIISFECFWSTIGQKEQTKDAYDIHKRFDVGVKNFLWPS